DWIPIGKMGYKTINGQLSIECIESFMGSFDGNYQTIKLKYDDTCKNIDVNTRAFGLFAAIEGEYENDSNSNNPTCKQYSNFKDLTIDINMNNSINVLNNSGTLAAATYFTNYTNITVKGNIKTNSQSVSGFFGVGGELYLKDCKSYVNIEHNSTSASGNGFISPFIGQCNQYNASHFTIFENCESSGTLSNIGKTANYFNGQFVGQLWPANLVFINCKANTTLKNDSLKWRTDITELVYDKQNLTKEELESQIVLKKADISSLTKNNSAKYIGNYCPDNTNVWPNLVRIYTNFNWKVTP
ncbi:MAG: hypothetical protein RR316_02910, partial [Clostridia bacterium]